MKSIIKRYLFKILPIYNRFFGRNIIPLKYRLFGRKKLGHGNFLDIQSNVILKNCNIKIIGQNCKLFIGDGCKLIGAKFLIMGNDSKIIINSGTTINASNTQPTVINAIEGKSIVIGKDCMLSNNIEIHNSDYHTILNSESLRINDAEDIVVGNHVWIGFRSILLKGTKVGDNTIIASNTLVNKNFEKEENVLIAGIPGRVVRKNINWCRQLI
ncbi:MAG: hypothetical protein J1D77_03400 [Muribaculaceae bacterium]|nr:hypothetical protein [Muribaculaceae bacterium]